MTGFVPARKSTTPQSRRRGEAAVPPKSRARARVHGTCVALAAAGVLLRGPSGSGKSDLALRLIGLGAKLVADDQVELALERGAVIATAPATLAGRIEIRGLGIVTVPTRRRARIRLVVDLVAARAVPRLPDPTSCSLLGVAIPHIRLAPFEASAPLKVRFAIARRLGAMMVVHD